MSQFLNRTIERAKADKQTIVLPEGNDVRTLEAAEKILQQDIANIILLGDETAIASSGYVLDNAQVINPATAPQFEDFAQQLFKMREAKGLTLEGARELVAQDLYFGVMMVYNDVADGMVAGACHATADVLRPCLQILKTAKGTKLVSAFFVIAVPDCEYGVDGVFVFADSGLVENPDADELSEIALSSADSFEALVEVTPRVAMLSYSTYGSAKSVLTEKVIEATRLAKEKAPHLSLDGELQLDAAIVPSVGKSKAPSSDVAGTANVLIFPNLDSGNIAYKLAQRLAKAEAYGPITQG
ncbi:MAG: phosphate acetyltransferase, partial [Actinobacteria bacterium]|nr:phosphate acetyltransferase [Actinomycetota bacterium]